jgi:hypothetical protein
MELENGTSTVSTVIQYRLGLWYRELRVLVKETFS